MTNLPLNAIRLRKLGDGDAPEYFILLKELDIGSAETNPLCLPCEDVSELHAKLVMHNGRLRIADLGTGEGTWVNGERLPPHTSKTLKNEDQLWLGSTNAVIRYVPKKNME